MTAPISSHPRGKPTSHNGVRYRSAYEARVAQGLEEDGISFKYEAERLPYELPCIYVPDITLPHDVLVECKGRLTGPDRRKLIEVKRAHPDADIRILFQRASSRLQRGPKRSMTYGEWATKHGFPWAEGPKIPPDWILGD